MKKFWIVTIALFLFGVLLGMAFPAMAASEMSFGASTNNDNAQHKRGSLDYLWRPNNVVWGVSMNNSRYVGQFRKKPVAVDALDFSLLIGYWSNKDKEHWLGWHGCLGAGFSTLDVRSDDYAAKASVAVNGKAALGLDLYLLRNWPKNSLALFVETMGVSQAVKVYSKMDGAVYEMRVGQISTQIGVRLWF